MLTNYALPILPDEPCQTILMCNSKSKEELKKFLQKVLNDIDTHGKPIQGMISQFNATSYVCTIYWNGKEY